MKTPGSAKQLLFLKVEALRPADVLVTRGQAFHSKVIAAAQPPPGAAAGRASHAAIVTSPFTILEATTARGTAPAPLLADLYTDADGPLVRLDADEAVVLRHPDAPGWDDDGFVGRLAEAATPYIGLEYARWARLVRASIVPSRAVEALADLLEAALRSRPVAPGPFCSMLVVELLHHMSLDPFDAPWSAGEIGPNRLLDSCLEVDPDAVVSSREEPTDVPDERDWFNQQLQPGVRTQEEIYEAGRQINRSKVLVERYASLISRWLTA